MPWEASVAEGESSMYFPPGISGYLQQWRGEGPL